MKEIIQKDNDTHNVLRQTAESIPDNLFGSEELAHIVADMKAALASQDDGVAIAAPQIGISRRIFVVSGKVFIMNEEDEPERPDDMVCINPDIVSLSKEKEELEEGCLSVRYKYGKVLRSKKAKIRAYDQDGRMFERGASGLLAQIFQHETDHLNGVLFIDKAEHLFDISPEEWEKRRHYDNT